MKRLLLPLLLSGLLAPTFGQARPIREALEKVSAGVRHGAVRRNDWSEFIVEAPRNREGNVLTGDNYRLELASGWEAADSCGVWRLRPTQP